MNARGINGEPVVPSFESISENQQKRHLVNNPLTAPSTGDAAHSRGKDSPNTVVSTDITSHLL